MIIPGGVLFTAPVLAEIGPVLLDLVEDRYRHDGLSVPENGPSGRVPARAASRSDS
ncbi:MAG: hypothetical protein ABSE77_09260 [Acidimicrobiales bacterium]